MSTNTVQQKKTDNTNDGYRHISKTLDENMMIVRMHLLDALCVANGEPPSAATSKLIMAILGAKDFLDDIEGQVHELEVINQAALGVLRNPKKVGVDTAVTQ